MGQILRLVLGSLILLTITGEPGRAADQQFSCKGDVVQGETNPNPLDQPKPVDLNVTLGDENKLSIKTGDGKLLSPRITSDNKLQLRFETDEFVGEYFHYTGQLFLIYHSGQLVRLTCSQSKSAQAAPPQGQPPALKQIALTDEQVEGVVAAQKEMNPITEKLPDNAPADPKVMAQLEAIAKKHGFASYDDYSVVINNISLVLSGIDPVSKKYVGSESVINSQIAQVEADKKMSASDKKQALEELNNALKTPEPPLENKGNIDLVLKYYDKLEAVMDQN